MLYNYNSLYDLWTIIKYFLNSNFYNLSYLLLIYQYYINFLYFLFYYQYTKIFKYLIKNKFLFIKYKIIK